MEKTIKMPLETAREIYKELNPKIDNHQAPSSYEIYLYTQVIGTFTKDELEGKKGFTLEDSFKGEGYYISVDSEIQNVIGGTAKDSNKNTFVSEKQALSALAFSQLSHIVAKYNEGKSFRDMCGYSIIHLAINNDLIVQKRDYEAYPLPFVSKADAETSLEVNNDLWKQYWMI